MRLGPLQHFPRMPRAAGRRDFIATVRALAGQVHAGEAGQARTVFQAVWPADRPTQGQPVQRGAAAGLEIGLVPHARMVGGDARQSKAVSR